MAEAPDGPNHSARLPAPLARRHCSEQAGTHGAASHGSSAPPPHPRRPQVLAALRGAQFVLVRYRILRPGPRGAGLRELLSCVTLNAITLAVACSTYYR